MKIALLSGSLPPEVCGVGNYTDRLCREFQSMGLEARAIKSTLDAKGARDTVGALRKGAYDIVHLQYPTIGFGNGLGPHAVSLVHPLVVTIHEMSRLHPVKRLFTHLFSARARGVVFTTEKEKEFAMGRRWWRGTRCAVIPVGCNIPSARPAPKDLSEIVFFGLFRPRKGLEEFLELAELIHDQGSTLGLRIIGSPDVRKMDYYNDMRRRFGGYRVMWEVGLSDDEVADRLARSKIAYMPFPDGASDYRTSLLALLANGVAVVSNLGEGTPRDLERVICPAASPMEALGRLRDLLNNPSARERLSEEGRRFSKTRDWRGIAQRHVSFYEDILEDRHRS